MTIYPLPPSELDDKTLDKQIKAIAQVLCNVHWCLIIVNVTRPSDDDKSFSFSLSNLLEQNIPPLRSSKQDNKYSKWASKCRANYLELVKMGENFCTEYAYRLNRVHKLDLIVIDWSRDNVPYLYTLDSDGYSVPRGWNREKVNGYETPFPVVIPRRYFVGIFDHKDEEVKHNIIESYRNYYKTKLPKNAIWTRREKPEWLND